MSFFYFLLLIFYMTTVVLFLIEYDSVIDNKIEKLTRKKENRDIKYIEYEKYLKD